MIRRHTFRLPDGADALSRLRAAAKAEDLSLTVSGTTVTIARRHAFALLNGFSPVFVGRLREDGDGSALRGRFRLHLGAVFLIAGFLGLSAWSLLQVLLAAAPPAGATADWRAGRIQFELQFLGFSALAIGFAWLAGRPMRERIAAFIERHAQPPAAPAKRR